jgi:hypothetical protein
MAAPDKRPAVLAPSGRRDTGAMHTSSPPSRRRCLQWAGAALTALALPPLVAGDGLAKAGGRLTADFDPISAIWLGYDPGHEAFTADLVQLLSPHVPIRMLVRDAQAQARAMLLLRSRGINTLQLSFVHDERAPFFVRDAAVFGLDGRDKPFIVDFAWTHYGWSNWCRRTFAGSRAQANDCARTDDLDTGALDQRMAAALGLASLASPLAIEGGGVEVNGRRGRRSKNSCWPCRACARWSGCRTVWHTTPCTGPPSSVITWAGGPAAIRTNSCVLPTRIPCCWPGSTRRRRAAIRWRG